MKRLVLLLSVAAALVGFGGSAQAAPEERHKICVGAEGEGNVPLWGWCVTYEDPID